MGSSVASSGFGLKLTLLHPLRDMFRGEEGKERERKRCVGDQMVKRRPNTKEKANGRF